MRWTRCCTEQRAGRWRRADDYCFDDSSSRILSSRNCSADLRDSRRRGCVAAASSCVTRVRDRRRPSSSRSVAICSGVSVAAAGRWRRCWADSIWSSTDLLSQPRAMPEVWHGSQSLGILNPHRGGNPVAPIERRSIPLRRIGRRGIRVLQKLENRIHGIFGVSGV